VTLWVVVANRSGGHHLPLISFIRRRQLLANASIDELAHPDRRLATDLRPFSTARGRSSSSASFRHCLAGTHQHSRVLGLVGRFGQPLTTSRVLTTLFRIQA
jgi:hypothetical protein